MDDITSFFEQVGRVVPRVLVWVVLIIIFAVIMDRLRWHRRDEDDDGGS